MHKIKGFIILFGIIIGICYYTMISENSYVENIINKDKLQRVHRSRIDLIKSFSKYDAFLLNTLETLSLNKVEYNDRELITIVKQLIDFPSERKFLKKSKGTKISPQAEIIDAHLKQKRNGFFVEVGAFDGEELSNTIFFEESRDWKGLLIEADPYYYIQLIGKNRRSYSINACLSDDAFVHLATFLESEGSHGKMIPGKADASKNSLTVPCFALQTILLAINVSKIDFFSLDVEGFEMPILKTVIPDRNLHVDILAVEYVHSDKNGIRMYMEAHNYTVIRDVNVYKAELGVHAADFILVKNPM